METPFIEEANLLDSKDRNLWRILVGETIPQAVYFLRQPLCCPKPNSQFQLFISPLLGFLPLFLMPLLAPDLLRLIRNLQV